MILFVWGTIFMVTLIPGAIVGWLVGKIPCPTGVCESIVGSWISRSGVCGLRDNGSKSVGQAS